MFVKNILDREIKKNDKRLKKLGNDILDSLKDELLIEDDAKLDIMLQVLLLSYYAKVGKLQKNIKEFITLRTSLIRKYLKKISKDFYNMPKNLCENIKAI